MVRSGISAAAVAALLWAVPAAADVRAGVDAWMRGDYATAIKEWRQPAIDGDADAQFNMGQAYKLGRGVPPDLKVAEDWYRRAAQQGHLQAEENYGLILFQNGDRQKALPLIQKSADRGDPRAQYILATALFNGDITKKDWPRAYALMTRASQAGLPPASASLAQMDRYIPADQRQKGLAIARDIEAKEAKPVMIAEPSPAPAKVAARPVAKPATIKTEAVPASKPPVLAQAEKPATPKAAAPKPAPVATKPEKPAPPPAVAATSSGNWRVQLGAFGEEAKARALWPTLEKKVAALSGLQSYFVKAGAVTRLQAGPLASRSAAEKACASAKAAGQACLPVAP